MMMTTRSIFFFFLVLLLFQIIIFTFVDASTQSTVFRSENAKDASNLKDLTFVSRFMLPYGPDLYGNPPTQTSGKDQPYKGYGYGMGAAEEVAYDHINHYLYAASDQEYVMVVDYEDPTKPVLTEFSFDMNIEKYQESDIESMHICPEQGYLFIVLGDLALVEVFETVKRGKEKTPTVYKSLQLDTNSIPTSILPNKACTTLAIGRENPGKKNLAQGGVTLIRHFLDDDDDKEEIVDVSLDAWDDDYVLKKGLHMPLTKNSLHYWNELSPLAGTTDFSDVIENYRTTYFLYPKRLAWNGDDDEELLVNLQENNGLIRINALTATATAAVGYGLKDHRIVPVDINSKDKTCDMKTYTDLFAMRNPDTLATLNYNGRRYVVTANEGDSREFRDYEDRVKAKDVFTGNAFALPNVTLPKRIFDPNNITIGSAALFNSECEGSACVEGANIVLGSNAIDFESDPMNPLFHRLVLVGGRGWSIYEIPDDPDSLLKLVFDSGDAVESTGCANFPWSHNSKQDEEEAPAGDTFPNNTLWQIADEELREILLEANDPDIDGCEDRGDGLPGSCSIGDNVDARSAKDGSSIEQIVIGEACGRLVAAMAVEKNSIALLFDITELASPSLVKVFHLSEASEFKSAGIAYNDGTLGEIDPENSVFLPAHRSPSGKPGILFAGSFSGTVSFWEFECEEPDSTTADNLESSSNGGAEASSGSALWRLSVASPSSVLAVTSVFMGALLLLEG